MKPTKEQIRKEFKAVHDIYEGLNLRQMTHLLYLMSDRIEIPHAFNDGKTVGMKIEDVGINGTIIQVNTDCFSNHCENLND
jgi:hypothetical protein